MTVVMQKQEEMEELKIGFIDDQEDYLDHLMSEQIDRQVASVVTSDPAECMEWVRENKVDVLVVDLRMEGKDGLAIAQEAQNVKDLEIVLLTGHDPTPSEKERAEELGVPIHRKDSLAELLDGLEKDRMNPEMRRLRHREKVLLAAHSMWVEDFVTKLKSIPDFEKTIISSEDGAFTVAELVDDIKELRPRGREYIRLWQHTMDTLLNFRKERD
ncbi:MAG TPA: response regulator [Candidatus Angelobacter sp.]